LESKKLRSKDKNSIIIFIKSICFQNEWEKRAVIL